MKDDITKMLGMSDSKNEIYHYDLTEEIFQWRCRIRSLEFLRNPQGNSTIDTCIDRAMKLIFRK